MRSEAERGLIVGSRLAADMHDQAQRAVDTDWSQILALYGLLDQMTASPIVRLNRAIAAEMAHGPSKGLALLRTISEPLAGNYASMQFGRTCSRWLGIPTAH